LLFAAAALVAVAPAFGASAYVSAPKAEWGAPWSSVVALTSSSDAPVLSTLSGGAGRQRSERTRPRNVEAREPEGSQASTSATFSHRNALCQDRAGRRQAVRRSGWRRRTSRYPRLPTMEAGGVTYRAGLAAVQGGKNPRLPSGAYSGDAASDQRGKRQPQPPKKNRSLDPCSLPRASSLRESFRNPAFASVFL
jgi:hypothetical protein